MYVLGISAFYHDSAAALIKDGRIVWAASEERFSRIKHHNAFPRLAIARCLSDAGIGFDDLAVIAYYEKPLKKFERILQMLIDTYPRSLGVFLDGIPEWLGRKIRVEYIIREELGYKGGLKYVPHHRSHAAFAYYTSPFQDAAVMTVDGVGESQTTVLWHGQGAHLRELASLHFPHSLGLLYSTFTAYLGMRVNEDESKVMGLAARGTPRFVPELRSMLLVRDDGAFELDMRYFSFRESNRMWSPRFESLLGPAREPGSAPDQRTMDVAASLQTVFEDAYLSLARRAVHLCGTSALCISGGVALNATANGKILTEGISSQMHVPGPAGDDGAAAGAALSVSWAGATRIPREPLGSLLLGTEYAEEHIAAALQGAGIEYERLDGHLFDRVAQLLAEGSVVGWFRGRMEYGPRALGARSILASPVDVRMKARINALKGRDAAHPCAGSTLSEALHDICRADDARMFSSMTITAPMTEAARVFAPAILHADGTCRIQTVFAGDYHRLIEAFRRITGIPCVLNTSFNGKGDPIVEHPDQAIRTFLDMHDMDYLLIGPFLLKRPRTEARSSR